MFRNQLAQRITAGIVLTTFISLSLCPLTAAAQVNEAVQKAGLLPQRVEASALHNAKHFIAGIDGNARATPVASSDERFSRLLADIHEDLKAAVPQSALPRDAHQVTQNSGNVVNKGGKQIRAIGPDVRIETENTVTLKRQPGTDMAACVKSIKSKAAEVRDLYTDIDKSFKETEQYLKDAKLPKIIMDRHAQAVAQYESRKAEFDGLMTRVEQASANSADQQTALANMGSFMAKYPNAKPHQYTDPNKLPFKTPDGKIRAPYESKAQYQTSLFQPKYNKIMLAGAIPDGLKLAQATLPELPNALDTAETEDVPITPAIKAQAAVLNNNPIKIYNWVRNNIQFIPSYGSIQGSDMTLLNKRGNAFDTASLLIALYRASNIPARYMYGTIEVPADKVMNWVGGVTKPEAAQNLLGQGGIPNVALVSGGTVKAIRMEHVWVEAYVDSNPSRGAVNKAPGTWVPMDASFKQYQFTSGMDIKGNVLLSNQTLLEQVKQGATINEAGGYVQNLNQANLQSQLITYQSQIKTYIDSQKANVTVGDVLGTKTIKSENYSILMGSLPYKTIAIGSTFQMLPDNLRLKIAFNLYTSELDKANRSPAFTKSLNFSAIANKRLAVTYVPATEADQQLLKQYSDSRANTLPSYLVRQKAQLRLDNTVLAEYAAQQMGQSQYWTYTLLTPDGNQLEEDFKAESSVGDEIVFGVNGNGIMPAQVESRYHAVNPNTSLENLNLIALGYWARADMSDDMMAKQGKYVTYRQPSIGMFAMPLTVRYYFGVPCLASYKSYLVDIRRLTQSATSVNSGAPPTDFLLRSGMKNSYLEGAALEEILDLGKGQAMSAVAVIKEANNIGIPIWALTSNNLAAFQNVTNLSYSTRQSINDAIAAGLTVYAPQSGVDLGYWVGDAYIAIDPATGAGAYLLKNGANGGGFEACEERTEPLTVSISQQILTYTAIALAAMLVVIMLPEELVAGALIVAMRMLGMTALTFSTTSYAAGKCKSNEKCHRGRFQAQGGGLEASQPWAQATPLTIGQARALLTALQSSLTPADQALRVVPFAQALRFIENSAAAGGCVLTFPHHFIQIPHFLAG